MFHFDRPRDDAPLHAEGVDLRRLAEEVSTPTFVYARATLERHFSVFTKGFSGHPHLVCYSVKANSNAAVLRTLARLGSGADIVSGGELHRARAAGIAPKDIVFSGVGKTPFEMAEALDADILSFNVESEAELEALAQVAADKGKVAPVSLRVNPDVDAQTHPYIATGLKESKFGLPIDTARRVAGQLAQSKHLKMTGIDCHIGSQLTTIDPLLEAVDSVVALADVLRGDGHDIEHLDIGGGIGIPYKGETPPHPEEVGRQITAKLAGRPERLVLEPGRVIVGNAGVLLTRVLYVKKTEHKTFIIVDAAMNDLLRPSLYQAHHEIWPVERRPGEEQPVDIVGPICESGDCFAKARPLPPVEAGDLLCIMSAGAYGFVMASNYNSRPRAAEVLVDGDNYAVVRRRESVADLMKDEEIPEWLS